MKGDSSSSFGSDIVRASLPRPKAMLKKKMKLGPRHIRETMDWEGPGRRQRRILSVFDIPEGMDWTNKKRERDMLGFFDRLPLPPRVIEPWGAQIPVYGFDSTRPSLDQDIDMSNAWGGRRNKRSTKKSPKRQSKRK